jgi:segregation and condensation protein A
VPGTEDYKVELDVYCGPLDLLLHLVKREELTIETIPVARIADQFVRFLERLGSIDLDVAGDYIVMAARLTELKSKALLPVPPSEDEELSEDLLSDESDLIRKLLEYRVFKDLAKLLRRLAERRGRLFPRVLFPDVGDASEEITLEDILGNVTALDLFSAFQRIGREVLLEESRTVVYDEIPIERHILRVLERLEKEGALVFSHILPPNVRKGFIIGAFLALLELIKRKRIDIEQNEDFGSIRILPKPPETAGESAPPAASDPREAADGAVPEGDPPATAGSPDAGGAVPDPGEGFPSGSGGGGETGPGGAEDPSLPETPGPGA